MEVTIEFTRLDCLVCGMIVYFPENFIESKKQTHTAFFCGAGHSMCFQKPKPESPESLKSKIAKLENEKNELKVKNVQLYQRLEQAGVD